MRSKAYEKNPIPPLTHIFPPSSLCSKLIRGIGNCTSPHHLNTSMYIYVERFTFRHSIARRAQQMCWKHTHIMFMLLAFFLLIHYVSGVVVDVENVISRNEHTLAKTTNLEELFTNMTCKSNEDCDETRYLTCNVSSGQCICMDGYSPMNESTCGKKIGAVCDGECDALNSHCDDQKSLCVCNDDLTSSTDGTFCYGIPKYYGDVCEYDTDCATLGNQLRCINSMCLCEEEDQQWYEEKCQPILKISCFLDQLQANYNNDSCFTSLEPGDVLEEHEKQNKSTFCIRGLCSFKTNGELLYSAKTSVFGAFCNSLIGLCVNDTNNSGIACLEGECYFDDNKTIISIL